MSKLLFWPNPAEKSFARQLKQQKLKQDVSYVAIGWSFDMPDNNTKIYCIATILPQHQCQKIVHYRMTASETRNLNPPEILGSIAFDDSIQLEKSMEEAVFIIDPESLCPIGMKNGQAPLCIIYDRKCRINLTISSRPMAEQQKSFEAHFTFIPSFDTQIISCLNEAKSLDKFLNRVAASTGKEVLQVRIIFDRVRHYLDKILSFDDAVYAPEWLRKHSSLVRVIQRKMCKLQSLIRGPFDMTILTSYLLDTLFGIILSMHIGHSLSQYCYLFERFQVNFKLILNRSFSL
jgi:hypothetical protein